METIDENGNKRYVWEDEDVMDYRDDEIMPGPRRSKAIAIGVIISVAVVLGAIRLWNVFQRP